MRNFVQRRFAQHLVKRDPVELRRAHTADEADAFEAGKCTIVYPDMLAVPSHTVFELMFDTKSTLLVA